VVALLLLGGEFTLLYPRDLAQALASRTEPAQISAVLWAAVANLDGQWWIFALSALMLLVIAPLCAWWVYRHEYPGSRDEALAPYVARRVSQLSASDYVPKHAYKIDVSHPTTRLVRAALRIAKRSSLSRARVSYIAPLPIGVCIFGRPLHDKTGLAWAAMRRVLSGWSLVKWPHRFEHPENIEKLCGSRVVLWLDDLHEYANHVEAAQLDLLIDRFAKNGVQVVVVATCRWHEEEREARARLGYLFDHLLPIRLTEHPDDHNADPVVSQPTLDAPIKQSSRTNGNIALKLEHDIANKRAHFTRLLAGDAAAQSAATILRAMTLLRRVGIRVYSRERVRAVANQLGLDPSDEVWAKGLHVLQAHDYIQPLRDFHMSAVHKWFDKWWRRLRRKSPRPLANLEPVTIWYLDRVVDHTLATSSNMDQALKYVWEALKYRNDAEALTLLGDAYLNPRNPHVRQSGRQAINSYTAALGATGATGAIGHVIRRTAAHLGLGYAHMASAALLDKGPRQGELQAALDAFIEAANAHAASQSAPDLLLAEAFQGQGNAHEALADHLERHEARTTGADEIKARRTHAQQAFEKAVTRFTRAYSPFQWATVQYALANTRKRLALAQLEITTAAAQSSPQEALVLLSAAESGYRHARNVYTRANAPTDWAHIQRDLAEAQLRWVTAVNVIALDDTQMSLRKKRLEEAVETLRAAVLTFRQFGMQENAASANALLGEALNLEAQSMSESQAKQERYSEAYEVMGAALVDNRREFRPIDWAEANIKLAAVSLNQARLARAGYGVAPYGVDARVYAERARDCLYSARKIYRPPYGPPFENPDLSSYLNARIREVRERLEEVETFGVQVTYD
jgi:hypothetical protein